MALIDIGATAINRTSSIQTYDLTTLIDNVNTANAAGSLDTIELYFNSEGSDVKVATFDYRFISGYPEWNCRDYETIGTVTAGSKQTFSGLDITVDTDDRIGMSLTEGDIESGSGGNRVYYEESGIIPGGWEAVTTYWLGLQMSLYGTGVDPEEATVATQACSAIGPTSLTANGNVTFDGGVVVTRRGFCYKSGTSGDPTVADDTEYEDSSWGEGAYDLELTGLTANTGYRVRSYAINSAGTSYGATVQATTSPAAPADVAASSDDSEKVVVTWTKSTGATGYQIYRDGTPLGWLGDVATGDDTGADAPVITPGAAVASDGTYSGYINISIAGESVANGTTHSYKVRARNVSEDESPDSAADNGNRLAGSLTYQWQRSVTDEDIGYEDLVGATTDPYQDTEAPG